MSSTTRDADDQTSSFRSEDGFALLAVLLVLALLGVIGTEFAMSMRLEATMARSSKESIIAMHLAEAGLEQAIREILTGPQLIGHPDDEPLTFYRSREQRLPRLPREAVKLGAGEFAYRITDEQSRINLNKPTSGGDPTSRAQQRRLDRLLSALGLEKEVRDTIVDSIMDWLDTNEEHRLNGAESDFYLKLPIPYRARNQLRFDDIRELLQVRGVTPSIYYGHDGQPGLADFVTGFSYLGVPLPRRGQVNINTAPPVVLQALECPNEDISAIMQDRRGAPYQNLPHFCQGKGLVTSSDTFRIEAEGRIDGHARARVRAIVTMAGDGVEPTVIRWDPNAEARPEPRAQ